MFSIVKLNTLLLQVPLFILGILLGNFIISYDMRFLFLFFIMICSDLFNGLLKKLFKMIFNLIPNGTKIYKRPKNAGIIEEDGKEYNIGCSIYPFQPSNKESLGFPSGHSQTMGMVGTFLTLYLDNKNDKYILKYLIIWSLVLMVLVQRWYSNCHSLPQIITGTIIGIAIGYGIWELYNKINWDKVNDKMFKI